MAAAEEEGGSSGRSLNWRKAPTVTSTEHTVIRSKYDARPSVFPAIVRVRVRVRVSVRVRVKVRARV